MKQLRKNLNKKFSTKQQNGFTIIEVIVVVALTATLLVGMLGIFDWQNKIYQLEQANIFATGSARVAMNNILPVVAQGVSIIGSRTVSGTNYTTGAGTIIVQLPSFDGSNNVIDSTYDYVVYHSNGTNLNQIVELAASSNRKISNKLLSDKIQSFALSYNNGDPTLASQVTVDINTQSFYRGSSSATAHLVETIFLRNR